MHEQNRKFMQAPAFADIMAESDQAKGIAPPPFGKTVTGTLITLPSFEDVEGIFKHSEYMELLDIRRSKRAYDDTALTQEQLAFILWSVQGIQSYRGEVATFRPIPSGGARHPFETYIAVKAVEGLNPGLYRYLPTENVGEKRVTMEHLGEFSDYEDKVPKMLAGQKWAAKAPAILFFTCIPYRGEWRYSSLSHRVMLIDVGHVGQNGMLSATALGLGSCCFAAFDQKICDDNLGVDGMEEYTVYALSVGTAKVTGKEV